MNHIQISSDDVTQYAVQLQQLEQEVSNVFGEVKNKMMQIESVWNSPASQNLIQQFQSLNPVFNYYLEALDQYAMYLHQTAGAYQENEQSLQQSIQS